MAASQTSTATRTLARPNEKHLPEPRAMCALPDFDQLPDSALVRQSQLVPSPNRPGAPTVLPFSPATLWRRVADGSFPAPLKIGRVTAWKVLDVRAWLNAQAEQGGA